MSIRFVLALAFVFNGFPVLAQTNEYIVVNIDSFPTFVKTAKVECWKLLPGSGFDSTRSLHTLCEMKMGASGKWAVKHEIYADGDESFDTIRSGSGGREKIIRRSNSFEPSTTTITYNSDGTVSRIFYDADQRDDINDMYQYDKDKRLSRHIQTFADSRMVEEYTYDKESRVSSISRSSGSLTSKKLNLDSRISHRYDTAGRVVMTLEEYFGANETVTASDTIFWTYDVKDPKVTKRESRNWGKNQTTYVYRYDANGRMISKTCQYRTEEDNGNVFLCNYEWKYDEQGYCSYRFARDGELMQEWTFQTKYNEKGLPIECRYNVDGTLYIYRWTYTYWQ